MTDEVSEFQATMSEKRAQLERIKCLEEKVRCEKLEVDSLKAKAVEMMASGQQSHAASQAQDILNKFDSLAERIKVRLCLNLQFRKMFDFKTNPALLITCL